MNFQQIVTQYLLPLLAYGAITGVANLLLSKKSQVELWAESHPKAAALQKLLRAIGLDPWQIISAVSLWATSKLPDAQRSEGLKEADPKMPKPPKPPTFGGGIGPMGGTLALCLVFSLTGCALFGKGGAAWPIVEHCLPSPAALVTQVESVLLAGGDYDAALAQIAEADGQAAVICAVAEVVKLLGNKVGASPGEVSAEARGKLFLRRTGN